MTLVLKSALRAVLTLLVVGVPAICRAECVGKPDLPDLASATLAFTGTVTSPADRPFPVVFRVDRVWKGPVHRETLLFLVGGPEMTTEGYFQRQRTYLVVTDWPIYPPTAKEIAAGEPAGSFGTVLGICGGGFIPIEDATDLLKLFGRGRAPLP